MIKNLCTRLYLIATSNLHLHAMPDNGLQRVVARFQGRSKGPLLFVIGGIHGNEKAGIRAMKYLNKMLDVEPITNPGFVFRGSFIGLLGNIPAYKGGVRYKEKDLNRIWTKEDVAIAMDEDHPLHTIEHSEMRSLLLSIKREIVRYQPTEAVILDLHSTSSGGGIFTIPANDQKSITLARALNAPVITDMLSGLRGTTLHYFSDTQINNVSFTAITFEAGQHHDPLSINRCIAAVISCMKALGCVAEEDVENIHDNILIRYSKNLPSQSRLLYKHDIVEGDGFVMRPGYKNFQSITEGEHLADDHNGTIYARCSGLILMPLYQSQGSEGFYIVEVEVD